jgi:tetratricopeptide (TPR) repeat protein
MKRKPSSPDDLRQKGEAAVAREDYATAWQCFSECLRVLVVKTGDQNAAVATILFKLGEMSLLRLTRSTQPGDSDLVRDMTLARGMHERALGIRRRILEPNHAEIAQSLDALGEVTHDEIARGLRSAGDLHLARDLYAEGLAIWRAALGPNHPHVADRSCVLAAVYRDMGEIELARALLQDALRVARLPRSEDNLFRLVMFMLERLDGRPDPRARPSRLH